MLGNFPFQVARSAGILLTDRNWSEAGFYSESRATEYARLVHDKLNFTHVTEYGPRGEVVRKVLLLSPGTYNPFS